MGDRLEFLRHAIARPFEMGAIAPSSDTLARRMLYDFDPKSHKVVVELGAGTGVFTKRIVRRMRPDGRLILVERNPELAAALRVKFPQAIVVCDCASQLDRYLDVQGIRSVDYVVSGMPWTLLSTDKQEKIVSRLRERLAPGGVFVLFIYVHAAQFMQSANGLRRVLHKNLGRTKRKETVWMNIPPAYVWSWQKRTV